MKQLLILILAVFCLAGFVRGQQPDSLHFLEAIEGDGETLPHLELDEIPVFPKPEFESRRMEKRYYRLEQKVNTWQPRVTRSARSM